MTSRLRRFYVDRIFSKVGESLQLSPRETFHLHRVLRLKTGDRCRIFNRQGASAEALIEQISESRGAALQLQNVFPLAEKNLYLYIKAAQALPQKRKMDTLIDRAEELGVQELVVLETKRSVVRMKGEALERARKRWERIVVEAAKQSGSPVLTNIEGPVSFEKVLGEKIEPEDQCFLFHPDPEGMGFSRMMEEIVSHRRPIFLFFGPEGGFTEEELRLAEAHGVRKVFLGPSTLRLETAFLGVISAIRFLTR